MPRRINLSPLNAAYMLQWIVSALVEIMVCRPGRQAVFLTNAGLLSIEPLGTNFNEILIEI